MNIRVYVAFGVQEDMGIMRSPGSSCVRWQAYTLTKDDIVEVNEE